MVEAFKATLSEVRYADLLLHVVDASYEDNQFQIDVTNRVLEEIGAGNKEKLMVFNKMDIADGLTVPESGVRNLFLSAKTGEGLEELVGEIEERVFDTETVRLLIPYDRGDLSSYLCDKTNVISMEYREAGTEFLTEISSADHQRLKEYELTK